MDGQGGRGNTDVRDRGERKLSGGPEADSAVNASDEDRPPTVRKRAFGKGTVHCGKQDYKAPTTQSKKR